MKTNKNDKWLDDALERTIGSVRKEADFESFKAKHTQAVEKLVSRAGRDVATSSQNIWRIIMKSKITKLAAAAVIIIAAVALVSVMDKSISPAYALEQTIEANRGMRYLHIKYFDAGHNEVAKECWHKFDDSGELKNVRINWAEWMGGEIVVWNKDKTQILNQRQEFLITFDDEIYTSRVLKWATRNDPRLMVEMLYESEAKGEVKIEIVEAADKAEPIVVTATDLPTSEGYGNRRILRIDQSTRLVTSVELYVLKDGEYEYVGVIEYYDYNVPIDATMFTLEGEIPDDVRRIDRMSQEVGVAQGGLTDSEAAAKTVRQFLQAVIDKDFVEAAQIHGGWFLTAAQAEERFKLNILRIVSIDEPFPSESTNKVHPKRQCVPCIVEVEKNGQIVEQQLEFRVATLLGQRNRWMVEYFKYAQ